MTPSLDAACLGLGGLSLWVPRRWEVAETNAQALAALLSAPPRAVAALEKDPAVRVDCELLLRRAG